MGETIARSPFDWKNKVYQWCDRLLFITRVRTKSRENTRGVIAFAEKEQVWLASWLSRTGT
jgi:hypothetical protein